jgi:hypothetical protein
MHLMQYLRGLVPVECARAQSHKGQPPIALYPDECWFCGCCIGDCPVPGANKLEHPLNLRNNWKRKETGQTFRLGMKNPPPPNTRPPVGHVNFLKIQNLIYSGQGNSVLRLKAYSIIVSKK